jgi:ABC-type bacteriocin/lantibiotic exporter with double-glycine peptidase domain
VSFAIDPGNKLAIIGPTGSGKSTLVKVLLGLWSPTAGVVLHNHVDIREIDLADLRSRSGVVLQEPDIFGGTIRENIAMRRPGASMDEIRAAGRMACLDEEVLGMPLSYDTNVGDRGTALSGGQRQRLALARALIDAPDLLILDEATNHLDVHTEAKVDSVIAELGCTRIVVSHRLSAVQNADWVILLDSGRVTAQGTPKEVLPGFMRGEECAVRSA